MINLDAIKYWVRFQYYKIEAALISIFSDDGRRYEGDTHEHA